MKKLSSTYESKSELKRLQRQALVVRNRKVTLPTISSTTPNSPDPLGDDKSSNTIATRTSKPG